MTRRGTIRLAAAVAVLAVSAAAAQTTAAVAATWQDPIFLSQQDRLASEVQLGFAASGAAVAVWQEELEPPRPRGRGEPPAAEVVRARSRAADGSWSAPVQLSDAGIVSTLHLAVAPSARAFAAWRRTVSATSVVETAYRPDGWTPWGDPVGDATPMGDFDVALDEVGSALVLSTASYPRVLRATYRSVFSSTWTPAVELETAEAIHGQTVAFDRVGNATAVWAAHEASNVWAVKSARRSAAAGTWSAPVRLATMANSPSFPRVAVDGDGNAIAVWGRSDEQRYVIEGATRAADAEQWAPPVELSAPADFATQPQLAVSRSGHAVAVWSRSSGGSLVVQEAARPAGGAWSDPVDLSVPGRSAFAPQVAVDPRGNAVAVWSRYDGRRDVVQASLRPQAFGRWLPVDDLGPGSAPMIALDRSGNGVAAWISGQVRSASLAGAAPIVTEFDVPRHAVTGKPVPLLASATAWGSALAGSPRWDLGDGRVAVGAHAIVNYPRPGTYTVTVTQADVSGAESSAKATLEVVAPPEPLRIAVGRGIGPLRLGLPQASVTRLLGAPQSEIRARFPNGKRGMVARYPRPGGVLAVGYRDGRVVLLATSSRSDRTAAGIGPGSPRAAAGKLAGFRRSPAGFSRRADGTITVFAGKGPTVVNVTVALAGYARP